MVVPQRKSKDVCLLPHMIDLEGRASRSCWQLGWGWERKKVIKNDIQRFGPSNWKVAAVSKDWEWHEQPCVQVPGDPEESNFHGEIRRRREGCHINNPLLERRAEKGGDEKQGPSARGQSQRAGVRVREAGQGEMGSLAHNAASFIILPGRSSALWWGQSGGGSQRASSPSRQQGKGWVGTLCLTALPKKGPHATACR